MLLGGHGPVQREVSRPGPSNRVTAFMTETHSARDRYRSVVARRLSAARLPLVVLAAALLLACALSGLAWSSAVAIFLAVLAAFALATRRRSIPTANEAAGGEARPALENLPAANLAAAVPDPMIVFDADGATIHANDAAVAAFGSFVVGCRCSGSSVRRRCRT